MIAQKYLLHKNAVLRGSCLLLGLLLFAGAAQAQPDLATDKSQPFFSVFAAVGYSRTAFNATESFSGIEKSSSPQFRAQIDYHFNPYLSASVGMASLGSTAFRGVSALGSGVVQSGEISSLSAEAAVSGHLPLTSMSCVYARAGGSYMNVRMSQVTDGASTTLHSNGISPFTGVGVEVDCMNHVGFRMGMDWYFNAGNPDATGQGTINSAYGGFVFRFH
jgi:hypothetical protein